MQDKVIEKQQLFHFRSPNCPLVCRKGAFMWIVLDIIYIYIYIYVCVCMYMYMYTRIRAFSHSFVYRYECVFELIRYFVC